MDAFQEELKMARDALRELDGEIGQVSFDPNDPSSIESAISWAEKLIDEKITGFERNEFVASIAQELKENCREAILRRAAEARIKGGS